MTSTLWVPTVGGEGEAAVYERDILYLCGLFSCLLPTAVYSRNEMTNLYGSGSVRLESKTFALWQSSMISTVCA